MKGLNAILHSVQPPFSAGGVNLLPNFQKGGAWQDLHFDGGVTGKEGSNFFQGRLHFLQKKCTKIWNIYDKKSL